MMGLGPVWEMKTAGPALTTASDCTLYIKLKYMDKRLCYHPENENNKERNQKTI